MSAKRTFKPLKIAHQAQLDRTNRALVQTRFWRVAPAKHSVLNCVKASSTTKKSTSKTAARRSVWRLWRPQAWKK